MGTNFKRSVPSNPWSQLALFLLLLGAAFIFANIVGGGILVAKLGIGEIHQGMNFSDPHLTGVLKAIQALSTIIIFGIPAFGYAWRTFRDQPMHYLGFRPVDKKIFYLLAIILLVGSIPFEGWLGQLNKGVHLPGWMIKSEADADQQITAFLKANSILDVLNNIFIIALLPAIFEEACFRGALQRILIQLFKSPWAGIIVTAIFFSAFHFQFQGFLPRFLLGALLGAIYWYSGSLWTSILAHFFINGIQVVAVIYYPGFMTENPSVPVYTALISLVIIVGLLLMMRRRSTVTYANVYEEIKTDAYDDFPS
jgi:membrane protease YdiL (CAAX protease family)